MRSLAVIALLAACTLHVEMDVRSVPALAQGSAYTSPEQKQPPWRAPQVGVTSARECNPMLTYNLTCNAGEWSVLDPATCAMKCQPTPFGVSGISGALGSGDFTVTW